MLLLGMSSKSCTSKRLGARNDLDQLLGDGGLACAVVVESEAIDHFAGVAGCVVHRGHPCTLFAGGVLEQRREDLNREVFWQQFGEDLLLRWFELVDRTCTHAGFQPGFDSIRDLWGKGDQLPRCDDLSHR